MKKHPRIYSLSTIGLRQHQEFDYLFHPFRTDFVGDSGCGKSMIADLLQLIFVGAAHFRSPTKSNPPREPKGMVLPLSHQRGTGSGYAFLNIELAREQYVVIGIYLESTNNSVQHYFIQRGFEENNLKPFSEPLTVADLLVGGSIPTGDELDELLKSRGLARKQVRIKAFHQWLTKHGLLPLDLSVSDKTLKDYASIIQSFSRGSALNTSSSASIKEFLFGAEKGAEMYEAFRKAVAEMHDTTHQYGLNRREIDDITAKNSAIVQLHSLMTTRDESRRDWLFAACAYHLQQEVEHLGQARELARSTKDGLISLGVYKEMIDEHVRALDKRIPELKSKGEAAIDAYASIKEEYSALQKGKELVAKTGFERSDLVIQYEHVQAYMVKSDLAKQLGIMLDSEHLLDLFEHYSALSADLEVLVSKLDEDIATQGDKLSSQLAILQFADINEDGTLGSWAIRKEGALTLEQESVLMHFKSLSLTKPEVTNERIKLDEVMRAVTQPNALFGELQVMADKPANGFWLYLNGLEEFIPYVSERLFSENTIVDLAERLDALAADARKNAEASKEELARMKKLRASMLNLSSAKESLAAYSSLKIEVPPAIAEYLNFPREEFTRYSRALSDAQRIDEAHATLKSAVDIALKLQREAETSSNELRVMLSELNNILETNRWTDELEEVASSVLNADYYNNPMAIKQQIQLEVGRATNISRFYRTKIDAARGQVNTMRTLESWNQYRELVSTKGSLWFKYTTVLGESPTINLAETVRIEEPSEKQVAYSRAEVAYEGRFDLMVEQYCPTEAHRFIQGKDYDELCSTILPDVLGQERPKEMSVIDAIARHLHNINEKAKELNGRKLQKIKDLLDEVYEEANNRMDVARRIDNFLNKEEREITAGHRVRLEKETSRQYPIQWMLNYAAGLKADDELFSPQGASVADVTQIGVSLGEKMLEAFANLGGSRSDEITVERLLDPNSYFELDFLMRSQSNQQNGGSSGQTYTAIALLCIARLSLVGQSGANEARGLRFMPIDEAEGLGTNYELLHQIAKEYDYQLVSLSISPLGSFKEGGQYLYGLNKNADSDEDINNPPLGIFKEAAIDED